jgi:branched-subunit amino acid transport protein AzlD
MVWRFLKKLKTELPCDLAILFLGIYRDQSTIQKETKIFVFTAALFAIAKTWKHGNNLSIH